MSLHDPISPLRALYVQKVLPAVYDDSLSYYEVLAKTQEKLNEVIEDTNEVNALLLELQQAMVDFIHGGYTDTFEEYLDEWFEDNADEFVQRLIDEGVIPNVEDLQNDLDTVHGDIADLVASDASIRNDMVAADTELQAEDASIRSDMEAADTELQAEDASIRSDMNAADTAIRSDMNAADTAIRSDMNAADTAIRSDMNAADLALTNTKVPYPLVGATPSYGTNGQVLATNADGTTDWQDPVVPSDAQAAQVITQWLNNHPEATTTVQDGSISTAKLANGAVTRVKLADGAVSDAKLAQSGGVLDAVDDLDNALGDTVSYFEDIISNNSSQVVSPLRISYMTLYGTMGYFTVATKEFTPNSNYKVYYFEVDESIAIYHNAEDTEFCQIVVYDDTLFGDDAYFGSSTNSTLPTIDSPFRAIKGNVVAVCLYKNDNSTTTKILTYRFKDYRISDETIDDFTVLSENIYTTTKDVNLRDTTVYGTNGYIDLDTGAFISQSAYKVYYYTASERSEIYYDGIYSGWLEIAVYQSTVFENPLRLSGSSRNNLPTTTNRFNVEVGNVVAIVVAKNVTSINAVKSASKELMAGMLEGDITLSAISLKKTGQNKFSISVPNKTHTKYCRYDFTKTYKKWDSLSYTDAGGQTQTATNVVSSDFWNNYYVYDSDGNYIAQGNSNFIVKVVGENKHVGNDHGNEVMLFFQILADGIVVDFDSMETNAEVQCEELRLIYTTNMFADGNASTDSGNDYTTNYPKLDNSGIPIINFVHHMEIQYKIGNEIEIRNKLVVKQNNISFSQCHGAMLDCNYGTFRYIRCGNTEETVNSVSDNGAFSIVPPSTISLLGANSIQKTKRIEIYGKHFYISQELEKEKPNSSTEQRTLLTTYSTSCKFYFQPVITSTVRLDGETIDTFNTGDVIAVKAKRVINLL